MASIGFYIWLIIIFLPNKISDHKKIIEIKKAFNISRSDVCFVLIFLVLLLLLMVMERVVSTAATSIQYLL